MEDLTRAVTNLVKAKFASHLHPRWPSGAPGGLGGQFMRKGEAVLANGREAEIVNFGRDGQTVWVRYKGDPPDKVHTARVGNLEPRSTFRFVPRSGVPKTPGRLKVKHLDKQRREELIDRLAYKFQIEVDPDAPQRYRRAPGGLELQAAIRELLEEHYPGVPGHEERARLWGNVQLRNRIGRKMQDLQRQAYAHEREVGEKRKAEERAKLEAHPAYGQLINTMEALGFTRHKERIKIGPEGDLHLDVREEHAEQIARALADDVAAAYDRDADSQPEQFGYVRLFVGGNKAASIKQRLAEMQAREQVMANPPQTPKRINVKWLDRQRREELINRLGFVAARDGVYDKIMEAIPGAERGQIKRQREAAFGAWVKQEVQNRVGEERAERWVTPQFFKKVAEARGNHRAMGVQPGMVHDGDRQAAGAAGGQLLDVLRLNKLLQVQNHGGGINGTYKGRVQGNGLVGIKPDDKLDAGKRFGVIHPNMRKGADNKHEVAAYQLMQHLARIEPDLAMPVPRAVYRDLDALQLRGKGVVMEWFEAPSGKTQMPRDEQKRRAGFWDNLIGQHDRHGNNWLDLGGKIHLIDHGFAFPFKNKGRMWNADFIHRVGGESLSAKERGALEKLKAEKDLIEADLGAYLDRDELDAMWRRVDWMLTKGRFPTVDELNRLDNDNLGVDVPRRGQRIVAPERDANERARIRLGIQDDVELLRDDDLIRESLRLDGYGNVRVRERKIGDGGHGGWNVYVNDNVKDEIKAILEKDGFVLFGQERAGRLIVAGRKKDAGPIGGEPNRPLLQVQGADGRPRPNAAAMIRDLRADILGIKARYGDMGVEPDFNPALGFDGMIEVKLNEDAALYEGHFKRAMIARGLENYHSEARPGGGLILRGELPPHKRDAKENGPDAQAEKYLNEIMQRFDPGARARARDFWDKGLLTLDELRELAHNGDENLARNLGIMKEPPELRQQGSARSRLMDQLNVELAPNGLLWDVEQVKPMRKRAADGGVNVYVDEGKKYLIANRMRERGFVVEVRPNGRIVVKRRMAA